MLVAQRGEIPAASAGMTDLFCTGMAERGAGMTKFEGQGSVNTPSQACPDSTVRPIGMNRALGSELDDLPQDPEVRDGRRLVMTVEKFLRLTREGNGD